MFASKRSLDHFHVVDFQMILMSENIPVIHKPRRAQLSAASSPKPYLVAAMLALEKIYENDEALSRDPEIPEALRGVRHGFRPEQGSEANFACARMVQIV
ncbi:hypothetical protein GJ744_000329 [Endocarpon pusillum]|uniref:Uncharacterized protein n=1 Tax=Endocarpon pusillum TaxID=364733 RepID=A0A8H7AR80_9EURO|nr:hypothetical protein GJ744_000329 [Endocarpon pusillum]